MQNLAPEDYARLALPDQFIEDLMQEEEARWIVDQVQDCESVLELGWGSGIVTRALAAAGMRVTVVEGAGESVAQASRVPGVMAIHSMFEDYAPPVPVDCVVASFVLEHVADPVALLRRIGNWTRRLVVVVGNAESWHRRLAVQMGLQEKLESLSARDRMVGHHLVYSAHTIEVDLYRAGWLAHTLRGLMFKPLPNAMLEKMDKRLIGAMCKVDVEPRDAANIGIVCERV